MNHSVNVEICISSIWGNLQSAKSLKKIEFKKHNAETPWKLFLHDWQLSSGGMCKFVTWSDHFSSKSNAIFNSLWAYI